MKTEEEWIDEKEVNKIIKRALSTLRNDRSAGRGIPYTKWGNRFIRYNKSDVIHFMESRKIETNK